MPTTSYRTKTIHSILDPVAQQVGQLVILHEQAEDGNAMSDLTSPIKIVAQAVSNLVAVGKQTASTSKDEILRREMPPTFQMVERSSGLLVDASHMLQADPYSVPARKKLIDGARGILQGTSDLLFVFDESEVRKIVKICEQVLQLLAVSEVVDTMADILTFVQSLTPGATSMNGQVSARREELINASHAAQLAQHTEQFQKLIPLLVSSMKIYVFIVQDNKPGKQEAWENRTYIASKMIYHIQEIIRVLLAVDDDSFRVDDVTGLRAAQNHIRNNMEKARGWLGDPNAAPGGMGEKALRRILEDARKVASGLDGPQRAAIEQAIDEITAMTNELADLRAKGQGNSPRALQLASAINGKLANLQAQIDAAIAEVLKSSMGKLAYTAGGKMAQAKEWLNNPGVDDRGVGYRAIKDIIETGRKIAATCDDMGQRNELLRLCNETEALAKHLKDLCDKGQGNTPQAEAAAKKLSEKLGKLKEKMTEIVMGQVSSDFLDPMAAVQKLQEAALAPEGTPNREGTFTSRANIFLTNTNKAADTAARFADIADADKDTVDEINRLSNQVKELTPQVISAARIVLVNPGNKVAASHLDFMKKEWEGSMRELDAKLTSSLDVPAFMKASEESMKKQTEIAKAAVKQHDPQTFASSISNIALRGKNMVKVAKREADNSEDPEFKQKVDIASDKLTDCIPPTVLTGKQLMQDMGNPDKMANWQDANNKLMTSVAELKVPFIFVIPLQEYYPPPPPVPAPPPAQMGRAQPANQQPMGGPYNGPGSVSSYTPRTHSSGGPDLPGYQRAAAELQEALHSPPVAPMAPYYPATPAYSANRTDPLVHSASQQPYHAQPSGYQPVEAARTAPQVYAAPPAVPPVPQPPASYSPQVYSAPPAVPPVPQPPASYSSQEYAAPPVDSPVPQPPAPNSPQVFFPLPLSISHATHIIVSYIFCYLHLYYSVYLQVSFSHFLYLSVLYLYVCHIFFCFSSLVSFILLTLFVSFILLTLFVSFILLTLFVSFILLTLFVSFILLTLFVSFILLTLFVSSILLTLFVSFILLTLFVSFIMLTLFVRFILLTLFDSFILLTLFVSFILLTLPLSFILLNLFVSLILLTTVCLFLFYPPLFCIPGICCPSRRFSCASATSTKLTAGICCPSRRFSCASATSTKLTAAIFILQTVIFSTFSSSSSCILLIKTLPLHYF
ncbi:vinculin-like isoform X5 [Asterias rubens]|uniref:vinculin-like isoform X5 n=1 Tax=Asterias rubens TaxID=7604 RepID=UPI0014550935|nr:vinculin-like isoform X5 [Asterias rubens]XP_033638456.1 vinculin-like isoform X5 [Asterias rubens]XP_033638457.1 vinculin-like isoform X5 [Asterias rubens]